MFRFKYGKNSHLGTPQLNLRLTLLSICQDLKPRLLKVFKVVKENHKTTGLAVILLFHYLVPGGNS